MHLSLRTHAPLRIPPEVLWRWMLLAFGVIVFGFLCWVMLLAVAGQGSTNSVIALSAVKHCMG